MPKPSIKAAEGDCGVREPCSSSPHTSLFDHLWPFWQHVPVSQRSSVVMSHISYSLATAGCFRGKHLISPVGLDKQGSWESWVIFFPLLSSCHLCHWFNVDYERQFWKEKHRNSSSVGFLVSEITRMQEERQWGWVDRKLGWFPPFPLLLHPIWL